MNQIQCAICRKSTNADLLFCKWCGSLPQRTKVHINGYNILYHLQEIQIKIQKLGEKIDKSHRIFPLWNSFFASLEIKILIATFELASPEEQKKAFENYLIKTYFDQPKNKIDYTLGQFMVDKQFSFLLGWLFIFENHFYYIIKNILKKTPSSSYKDNVKIIVNTVMSNEDDISRKEYRDKLYFLYIIRNTLHRGAISDKNHHGKINGYNFHINKDQLCTLTTWPHFIFFVEGMIDTFSILWEQSIFDDYKKKERI